MSRTRGGRPLLVAGRMAALAVVFASVLVGTLAGPVLAADVDWGTPAAKSAFGAAIAFEQPVTLPGDTQRVEILVTLPGEQGPYVSEVDAQYGTPTTLDFLYDTSGGLYPNTQVAARWRVTRADGTQELSPSVDVMYDDTRYPWKTTSSDLVTVHWYDGDARFADKALELADEGVRNAAEALGVSVTEPFDFFVYADREGFCAAYGSSGCENVGGFAPLSPDIRTLFALVPPDEIDTPGVGTVIPHELTHLVFDAAAKNPYHYPPRWLTEGFAVYVTEGNAPSYRADLRQGVGDGTILPLQAYGNYFPPASLQGRFYLAYAESVDAVAYLVDTYGMDALVKLIRTYADGVSDDDAMRAATGRSLAEFDAEWLGSIGVDAPELKGPQPAAPGPVPSAWLVEPTVPVAPGETSPPSPSASPVATSSAAAGAGTPAPTTPPVQESGGGPGIALAFFVGLLGAGVLLILVALIGVRRANRAPAPAPVAGWGTTWAPPGAGPDIVPPPVVPGAGPPLVPPPAAPVAPTTWDAQPAPAPADAPPAAVYPSAPAGPPVAGVTPTESPPAHATPGEPPQAGAAG